MEDIVYLVVSGCKLAKELESGVQNAFGPAGDLPEKCEEIARIFREACDRLRAIQGSHVADEPNALLPRGGEAPVAVGPSPDKGKKVIASASGAGAGGGELLRQPPTTVKRRTGAGEDWSLQFTRMGNEKKEGSKKRITVEVAAPVQGNIEIAPEDGFTWRKYGQKEILHAVFPRAYYRCTHQKLYGCPAKKQVQRLDNNPHVFQVTYRGHHTCHTYSTAPTAVPPPPAATNHHNMSTDTSLFRWLSMAVTPNTSTTTVATPINGNLDKRDVLRIGNACSDGVVAPSAIGGGRDDGEYHTTVVDMADAMFNFINNGGGNNMDFIFSESESRDGKN